MFKCGSPPEVKPLPEGDKWRLTEPFWFRYEHNGVVVERTVPTGFITDGASIPRFYRWRFSPTGKNFRAAIAHDFLYKECPPLPRSICDDVFLQGMEFGGVNWWDRHVMHKAVRAFGWVAHGKHCKETDTSAATRNGCTGEFCTNRDHGD